MKRVLFNILGFIALLCGAVGLLLPILPTTPFVLCAAGCFAAGNPSMYRRLANNKYFGEYVRNYKEHTGISKATRLRGILFLWLTLGISAALTRKPLVWAILALVGIAVSIHILMIRRRL